ncbi:MAG: hypothetical protein IPG53_23795 [Ignavibacteriales bacterium]|nr:hypothetical protein [Ignavibacteriales bacterium]
MKPTLITSGKYLPWIEISELSQKAVENLRKLVSRKLNNSEIMIISIEQL